MFRRLWSHVGRQPVAYLALFVALGGTSYAAVQVPKNSVTSKQVKNNTLKSADLKNGKGVRGIDVASDSLGGAAIAESSLGEVPAAARASVAANAENAVNAANAANAQHATTATNSDNAQSAANAGLLDGFDSTAFLKGANVNLRFAINDDVPAGGTSLSEVQCEPGEKVLGGGGRFIPSISSDVLVYSSPVRSNGEPATSTSHVATGWEVRAKNGAASPIDLYAYAICAG